MTSLYLLLPFLALGAADPTPAPEDVKAGWVAFGVFIALGVAVVLLGMSLTKHLRRARDNADAGVFDPGGKKLS
jgi:hypothetical protein